MARPDGIFNKRTLKTDPAPYLVKENESRILGDAILVKIGKQLKGVFYCEFVSLSSEHVADNLHTIQFTDTGLVADLKKLRAQAKKQHPDYAPWTCFILIRSGGDYRVGVCTSTMQKRANAWLAAHEHESIVDLDEEDWSDVFGGLTQPPVITVPTFA